MCGIVGEIARNGGSNVEKVLAMRDSLCHRGPDDSGIWNSPDGRVTLGHRRLAIIDLSPNGRQPMRDVSNSLHVSFNGELYNYRELREELRSLGQVFHTESDTEVLIASYRVWGTDCLARFTGMFAFCLFDAEREEVLIARDKAGEKPVFYCTDAKGLRFASELKALFMDSQMPRTMNREALDDYLAYGFVSGDRCLIDRVKKLPPAHALSYSLRTGISRVWKYWELPSAFQAQNYSSEDLVEELERRLENAVRRQLVADVPVGVLLSGGIDSSLITAMASRVSPVRTYTVSFPGAGKYDEAAHAKLVASHFGTSHTILTAEPASVGILPFLARQFDEPIGDSSMVPTYLVSKIVRENCTVALGGDGGDELFGGYRSYSYMMRQERMAGFLPAPLRHALAAGAERLPEGTRGRNYLLALDARRGTPVARMRSFFDSAARRRLAPAVRTLPSLRAEQLMDAAGDGGATLLQRLTRSDFNSYLPDDILVKVDRASMLSSLEVRAPFLDPDMISFAFGQVPDSLRASGGQTKVLLRKLAARVLPPQLDLARKQGFSLPLQSWFKGEWGTYMADVLSGAPSSLFDKSEVQRLIAGQRRGLSNTARIFALTMLELWRREYSIDIPTTDSERKHAT